MLSERERRILGQIELGLSMTDPKFVAGLRSGRPKRPREYRLTRVALLFSLGFLAFATVLVTGSLLALLVLLCVGVVGIYRFVSRRLD